MRRKSGRTEDYEGRNQPWPREWEDPQAEVGRTTEEIPVIWLISGVQPHQSWNRSTDRKEKLRSDGKRQGCIKISSCAVTGREPWLWICPMYFFWQLPVSVHYIFVSAICTCSPELQPECTILNIWKRSLRK